MPSMLVGAQSGGVPLTSGNPYSGNFNYPSPLRVKLSNAVSGLVFVGYSGNLTASSGVGLSTGGSLDGVELKAGDAYSLMMNPAFGPSSIFVTCAATVSGTLRLFYDAN